jgi:amidase
MADNINLLTATAQELTQLLHSGSIDSQQLVEAYLSHVERHDDYLHAMIAVAPKRLLLAQAKILDEERVAGKTRSPIHGLPIILKVRSYLRRSIIAGH